MTRKEQLESLQHYLSKNLQSLENNIAYIVWCVLWHSGFKWWLKPLNVRWSHYKAGYTSVHPNLDANISQIVLGWHKCSSRRSRWKCLYWNLLKLPDKLDLSVRIVYCKGRWNLWGEPFGLRRREVGAKKCGDNFSLEGLNLPASLGCCSPQDPIVYMSPQLPIQWYHVSSLKLSVVGVLCHGNWQMETFLGDSIVKHLPAHHCSAFGVNDPIQV